MKLYISIFVIAVNLFLISCKKTRTCSCDTKSTSTVVTTPRSSAQPTTEVTTTSGEGEYTASKVKKDDMTRIIGCNSTKETSVETGTTIISVTTMSSVMGYTFPITSYETADRSETRVDESTCEIK